MFLQLSADSWPSIELSISMLARHKNTPIAWPDLWYTRTNFLTHLNLRKTMSQCHRKTATEKLFEKNEKKIATLFVPLPVSLSLSLPLSLSFSLSFFSLSLHAHENHAKMFRVCACNRLPTKKYSTCAHVHFTLHSENHEVSSSQQNNWFVHWTISTQCFTQHQQQWKGPKKTKLTLWTSSTESGIKVQIRWCLNRNHAGMRHKE